MKLKKKECTAFVYAFSDALMYVLCCVCNCMCNLNINVGVSRTCCCTSCPSQNTSFFLPFCGSHMILVSGSLVVLCTLTWMWFPVSSGKIHPTKKGLVWTDQQKIQSRPGARADLKHSRQMGIEGKLPDFSNGWALSAPINFGKSVKSPAYRHFRMMCDNFLIFLFLSVLRAERTDKSSRYSMFLCPGAARLDSILTMFFCQFLGETHWYLRNAHDALANFRVESSHQLVHISVITNCTKGGIGTDWFTI